MSEIDKIIDLATNWGVDVIQNPKFDNGDTSQTGAISMIISKMLVKDTNQEQLDKFKQIIQNKIYENLAYDRDYILSVDYGPCRDLYEAAQESGISENNFPCKTTMWIGKDHLIVSYGYRSPLETLYANESYYENKIASCLKAVRDHKHNPDDYYTFGSREEIIKEYEDEIEKYKKALEELKKNESC